MNVARPVLLPSLPFVVEAAKAARCSQFDVLFIHLDRAIPYPCRQRCDRSSSVHDHPADGVLEPENKQKNQTAKMMMEVERGYTIARGPA